MCCSIVSVRQGPASAGRHLMPSMGLPCGPTPQREILQADMDPTPCNGEPCTTCWHQACHTAHSCTPLDAPGVATALRHLVMHAQHCTPGREGTGLRRRHSDAAPCRLAAGTDLYGYGGCTEPHSAGVRTGPCHPVVTSWIRTAVAEILFGAELRHDRDHPQLHADGILPRGAMPTPKQR